jgi:hypothetical protein
LVRDISASGQEVFALSRTPDGRNAAGLNETITVHASLTTARAAHELSQRKSFIACRQRDVSNEIHTVLSPGESARLVSGPIHLALPSGVTGTRYTDLARPRGCIGSCTALQYDIVDIQVGRARAVLLIDFTALPEPFEESIIRNALARLADAAGTRGVATETTYPHPVATNDPLQGAFARGRTIAGGSATQVPWEPVRGTVGTAEIVPGGVRLRVFGSAYQGVGAPGPVLTNDQTDADVHAIEPGVILGVGCRSFDAAHEFEFAVMDPGEWLILQFAHAHFEQILLSGATSALAPTTTTNHVTVACASTPTGGTALTFAVNGTIVAHTAVPFDNMSWTPAMYINGVLGGASATFGNIVVSTW